MNLSNKVVGLWVVLQLPTYLDINRYFNIFNSAINTYLGI